MPDCIPFRLFVGDNVRDVVATMIGEMRRRGIQATGDSDSGSFTISLPIDGVISGSYETAGTSLVVSISQRPEAVSCGTIESKLQDLILDAKADLRSRPSG